MRHLAQARAARARTCLLSPVIAVLLGLAVFPAACRAPAPPAPQEERILWRHVATWSGHGNAQTESFTSDTGGFRFRWTTSNETTPGTGRFRLTLHSAISGRPLVTAVDERGVGTNTAYVGEDPRTFHVVIQSADVDWSVVVEEPIVVVANGEKRGGRTRAGS